MAAALDMLEALEELGDAASPKAERAIAKAKGRTERDGDDIGN